MEIAQTVRAWREKNDLTQEDVAKEINMSRPQYARLETGVFGFKAEYIKKIAETFNVSANELLGIERKDEKGDFMEIAQGLKRWREKQGLNQGEVANAIGTKQTIYSRYERGEQLPGSSVIKKIAETFHADANELLGIEWKD